MAGTLEQEALLREEAARQELLRLGAVLPPPQSTAGAIGTYLRGVLSGRGVMWPTWDPEPEPLPVPPTPQALGGPPPPSAGPQLRPFRGRLPDSRDRGAALVPYRPERGARPLAAHETWPELGAPPTAMNVLHTAAELGAFDPDPSGPDEAIALLAKVPKKALNRRMGTKAVDIREKFQTGASHLQAAPVERTLADELLVSGRVPGGQNRPVAAQGAPLTIGLGDVQRSGLWDRVVTMARESPLVTERQARAYNDAGVVDAFADVAAQNLVGVSQALPRSWGRRAGNWYPGGKEGIVGPTAARWGLSPDQATVALATQSPGTEWNKNVAIYEKLGDYWQRFRATDQAITPEVAAQHAQSMRAATEEAIATNATLKNDPRKARAYRKEKEQDIADFSAQVGRRWSELDPESQARMVRATDEIAHPEQSFSVWSPEGTRGGLALTEKGRPERMTWQSYENMAKALQAFSTRDEDTLSMLLGGAHKVRSFFNNLSVPTDPRFSTMDVQHVAASHLLPIGGDNPLVKFAQGAGADKRMGVRGSYGLYSEANERAARALGVRPSQAQSISWEGVKALFSPEQKRDKALVEQAQRIWQEHRRGRTSIEEVQQRIFDLAASHRAATAREKGQTVHPSGLVPPPWLGIR